MKTKFFLSILLVLSYVVSGQINEYYPEYKWYTIEGEHVSVHYHEGTEFTAKTIAKIGDEVWGPITSLYEYEPERVHYVIKDIDDYSNGATFFFDNKIEIWASALDFDLRGTHNWLRNVISHEFTHMVQIQALMKVGRRVPALYLQFLNYEEKRRPDILYGFPNVVVSYPLATLNIPAWFAEGTAQYMREEFNYDNWDTHRDMILRSYVLDGNMLTWNQMGVFGKTSLGNESVYNSGFALTKYISHKYGEDKLREITRSLAKWNHVTIDAAFEDVLGKDGIEIYNEWKAYLEADYGKRIADVQANEVKGEMIGKIGFGNFYPQFSEDGKKIYYISNKYADYFMTSLFEYDIEKKEEKMIQKGVRSTVSKIPGTDKIIYSKLSEDNPKWTNINDLYVYDMSEEEETRITFGLRANNPVVSPDGKSIVFLFQKDGTTNLGKVDIDGKNFMPLTKFTDGVQVYHPAFTPDSKTVYFGHSYHEGRDIAKVNTDGTGFEFVLNEYYDERNALLKGDKMYYSSDETGIFNIYCMDLKTGKKERLTNVTGGAFMPDIDENGNIAYAGYTSTGYKLFYLPSDDTKQVDDAKHYERFPNWPIGSKTMNGDMAKSDFKSFRDFKDKNIPAPEAIPYKGTFTDILFFPYIRVDNYTTSNNFLDRIKPGLFVTSTDMLNRYSIFAGASMNKRFERDLFLQFDYRNRLPLLFDIGLKPTLGVEIYSVSRKSDQSLTFDPQDPSQDVTTEITYDLFEVDFVVKHKIFNPSNELDLRFIYSKYANTISSFTIPISGELYPTTSNDYLKGKHFRLTFTHSGKLPSRYSDINPIGREVELQYTYEMNDFNPEYVYDEDSGTLLQVFEGYDFHRLEFNWKEHIPVWINQTLTLQTRLASILNNTTDDFFDFYLGGLVGMKSYPFYSVSGNELAWFNLTYRFPVLTSIDKRLAQLYVDKVFLSVFGDIGNAWNGDIPAFDEFKKGAGAEVRVKMNSFYLFPTSFFFTAAYSFDKVNRYIESFDETISYGKEWNFYGGILFDFSF